MTHRTGTDYIAIHCSATRPSQDVDAAWIDELHKAKGWDSIGYNWFIKCDGTIEEGRPRDDQGAHVSGYNHCSLGVCMSGGVTEEDGITAENNFSKAQWASLDSLVDRMVRCYSHSVVIGHRDYPDVAKECPSFDAIKWAFDHGYPVYNDWESEPERKWLTY